jgi:adenylosuccinate synthase
VRHVIVVDLGFGDAGKGSIVDWLCATGVDGEPVGTVARFNGGSQAAHTVVPDLPGRGAARRSTRQRCA